MPERGQEGLQLEMESFLLRVVPGLAQQWTGTTPKEIAHIEQIAGRPLPPFYRWFLTRMGQSMAPRDATEAIMAFTLGGNDSGTLRRIMGTIATESSLKITVTEWQPPVDMK